MEWISVNDRLPEEYKDVLTVFECGTYCVDYIDNEQRWYYSFPLIPFAWMPLPEKPKQ